FNCGMRLRYPTEARRDKEMVCRSGGVILARPFKGRAKILSSLRHEMPPLEVQLKGKLNYTRSGTRRNNSSEGRQRDVVDRICVINPVEDIKEFRPDFSADALVDRNKFDHGKVDVLLSRT